MTQEKRLIRIVLVIVFAVLLAALFYFLSTPTRGGYINTSYRYGAPSATTTNTNTSTNTTTTSTTTTTQSETVVVETYIRKYINTIVSPDPVLGGTWYVVSITTDPNTNTGTVVYEDGHIQETSQFSYTIGQNGTVTITETN